MFKIVSAEFKKILSKPGIYILSVLLTIILVLGVFIYSPSVKESNQISLNGTTFLDKYSYFIGDDETTKTTGVKVEADRQVQIAIENVLNYEIITQSGKITQKQYIENIIKDIKEKYKEYLDCYYSKDEVSISKRRSDLVAAFENLNSVIRNANINAANGSYTIVMTEKAYADYLNQYKAVIAWANTNVGIDGLEDHCSYYKNKLEKSFLDTIYNFSFPSISAQLIKSYTVNSDNTKLNTLNMRLSSIINEININLSIAQSSVEKNIQMSSLMTNLAQKYVSTCSTYVELIKFELMSSAFDALSANEQISAMYLNNYSDYNCKSMLVKYSYLFENNKTNLDYASPLTIGVTSNNDINAYDYAYFVLRLFSFVIIAFAIMTACNTIAGEIKDGSMRYLAIRPVNRTKIIFGKFLSILILSSILSIFSGIIAICVGGAVYGFKTLTILTIFNSNVAIIIHPLVMLFIYIISMLIELTIYTSIALLLSSLLRSDLLCVTLVLGLYLINTLLPVFVTGINSWLTFYPFSHMSLYSLFGSSVYAVNGSFLNALLGAKVYIATNAVLTLIIAILAIILPIIFASRIFKKKEL